MKKILIDKVKAPKVKPSDYTTQLLEDLKDPAEAVVYIEAAILEGDRDGFLVALGQVGALNRDTQVRWRS